MWLTYSVFAAICFGLRGILYHWSSQKPLNRNLLLCGAFMMGALINLVCAIVFSSEWTAACLIGVFMGIFSFGANGSMFKGFAVGKASLVAILTALPAVVVVVMAFLFWGEKPYMMQLIAFVIIVGGVLLVKYSNDITLRNLQGAQWGLLALLLFAANDLSGKWSTIAGAELFPTMFCMFITGTICFGIWWLRDYNKDLKKKGAMNIGVDSGISAANEIAAASESLSVNVKAVPWSIPRTFFVGMAIGITNAVGMMLIITAFDYGKAGLVSAVVAMNVLLVLLYTRFVVLERFTRTEVAGIFLAFIGILLMRFFGA